MKRKDFFAQLKSLVGKYSEQAPEAEVKPDEKKPEAEVKPEGEKAPEVKEGEQAAEVKPEEKKEEKKEGEEQKVELAKDDKKDNLDYAAIQAELGELRKKVQVLDEYTWLKQRHAELENQVSSLKADFKTSLELMEQFAQMPQEEGEKVKTGLAAITGSGNSLNEKRAEWTGVFNGLKKKQEKTKA
jgi:hypothetical protein